MTLWESNGGRFTPSACDLPRHLLLAKFIGTGLEFTAVEKAPKSSQKAVDYPHTSHATIVVEGTACLAGHDCSQHVHAEEDLLNFLYKKSA